MGIFQAIIYGIVQGIGEFLPISSTAHLILVPWLLKWPQPGVAFDVALHLGTATAVLSFFWRDWIRLIKAGITEAKSKDGKLFWFLMIATVPGGIFGVALDKYMSKIENIALIAIMLIVMGIVLYIADKFAKEETTLANIGLKNSTIIGISQCVAMIPGVSRSGITMTVGRFLGIKREDIAKFTFLLSTPIILGDGLYHAKGIIHTHISIAPFIVAIITAAVVGILSIRFLLNYLKNKGFRVFAIYRFILGAIVLAMYFIRR